MDTYKEYKKNKETIQDSLSMLEEEKDEDMREMLKEELSDAKKRVEELEHELKILLLPKDPNDNKNVIVEIRAWILHILHTFCRSQLQKAQPHLHRHRHGFPR